MGYECNRERFLDSDPLLSEAIAERCRVKVKRKDEPRNAHLN